MCHVCDTYSLNTVNLRKIKKMTTNTTITTRYVDLLRICCNTNTPISNELWRRTLVIMCCYYYVGLNLKLVILLTNLSASYIPIAIVRCPHICRKSNKIFSCTRSVFYFGRNPKRYRIVCMFFFCSCVFIAWLCILSSCTHFLFLFFLLMDAKICEKCEWCAHRKFAQSSHWHTKHLI